MQTDMSEHASREERIARIVGELSDRLNSGEKLDIPGIVAAHPDLAPELQDALCLSGEPA